MRHDGFASWYVSNWVYKIKTRVDGSVKRYKTHSVAKDFTQEYGFDFVDTFAPIYKLNSVKSLLAVSNSMLIEATEHQGLNVYIHNGKPQTTT